MLGDRGEGSKYYYEGLSFFDIHFVGTIDSSISFIRFGDVNDITSN